MSYTAFTRIRTCALAIAAVLFVGSQASAQPQGGPNVTVVNTPLPVTVTNQAMPGTPVAFTLGDTIDLADINFGSSGPSLAFSKGVLTVSDGTHVAKLNHD